MAWVDVKATVTSNDASFFDKMDDCRIRSLRLPPTDWAIIIGVMVNSLYSYRANQRI